MQTLKSGDVRKKGDEVRSIGVNSHREAFEKEVIGKDGKKTTIIASRNVPEKWRPTYLIGHEIMGSDTMHLEFRRK
jgi:hypothetical protein